MPVCCRCTVGVEGLVEGCERGLRCDTREDLVWLRRAHLAHTHSQKPDQKAQQLYVATFDYDGD